MNVYDFDGTIYAGDSSLDFYIFCLKHYPKTRRAVFAAIRGALLYLFGVIEKTRFKERFFSFLQYIPNIDEAIAEFWRMNENKIKSWYLSQKADSDIIISASPEFLLLPICVKLGVMLISSRVDKQTGKFDGLNCRGKEKISRFKAKYGETEIENFYSDHLSDTPLAEMAKTAFFVKGSKIMMWSRE